ncbi:VWA domain-containing protein [Natronospirillum operosum]|uniref:VWA domain-containing protein n=1 Tax=Natronospirillum operosum TaxID=2759953 RepID=UPI003B82CCF9
MIWLQAALAYAAWQGRTRVEGADLDAVAPWVLAHRQRHDSPSSSEPPAGPPDANNSSGADKPPEPPQSRSGSGRSGQPQGESNDSAPSGTGDNPWGAMPPQHQTAVEPAQLSAPDRPPAQQRQTDTWSGTAGSQRGQTGPGPHCGQHTTDRPDWFATLVANGGQWPPRQWRFRPRRTSQPWLHLILIDTSGSTLKQQLFGRAKGLVAQLAQQAYRAREQFAVLGFGNDQVQELLPRRRAPKTITRQLDQWTGGGGTPLRQALEQAATRLRQWQQREPGLHIRTWIITDGRTRETLDHLPALGDCVVVDAEQSFVRRGRTRELARGLGAHYMNLPATEAT